VHKKEEKCGAEGLGEGTGGGRKRQGKKEKASARETFTPQDQVRL